MEKTSENQHQSDSSRAAADRVVQHKEDGGMASEFINNRPDALSLKQLRETMHSSPQAKEAAQLMAKINNSPYPVKKNQLIANVQSTAQRIEKEEPLQGKSETTQRKNTEDPVQGKADSDQPAHTSTTKLSHTGLPDNLKSGIESLSGMSMDKVSVHYNSSHPAQLNALAYAQGTDIHIAPGQEQHLPHEAWHVVQQTQGRVRPTMQMKNGIPINDDQELEQEANVMGNKALQMHQLDSTTATEKIIKKTLAPTVMGRQTVQRVLNTSEQDDKLRILRDYVQFTPPNHAPFLNEYGSPPKDKVQYKLKLLEKIRSNKHIKHSLKSKAAMAADEQDDDWSEGSFNVNTLITAIDDIYNHNLSRKDGTRLIGRTDDDFAHHDCVWAAVAYGLGRENSLEVERAIAAEHSSREGEVEDSILYRIMENLGWTFLGQGTFATMFPAPRPGVATTSNLRNSHNGRYIISEDKDAGGTQGHVFAVDVLDYDDASGPFGYSRSITFTDRQHERAHHDATRVNPPAFQVYVWKVTG